MYILKLIHNETSEVLDSFSVLSYNRLVSILKNINNIQQKSFEKYNTYNLNITVEKDDIIFINSSFDDLLCPLFLDEFIKIANPLFLKFSTPSVIFSYLLKKEYDALLEYLKEYENESFNNYSLICFKNGLQYSVDDLEVNGHVNHEVKSVIKNCKLEISFIDNVTKNISEQIIYDFSEISKICYLEMNNGIHFEVFLTF